VTPHASEPEQSAPSCSEEGDDISRASHRGDERANKKWSPFSFDSPGRSRNAPPCWSAHPREAAALLSLLFSWARGGGGDEELAEHLPPHAKGGKSGGLVGRETRDPKALSSRPVSPKGAASGRGKLEKSFTILCPATRVRMNIETYVKDSDTDRVAVQWSLASKDTGEKRHAHAASVGYSAACGLPNDTRVDSRALGHICYTYWT